MGGQLDGTFLAGSLPHEFIILIVTLFTCLWLINFSLSHLSSYKLHIYTGVSNQQTKVRPKSKIYATYVSMDYSHLLHEGTLPTFARSEK